MGKSEGVNTIMSIESPSPQGLPNADHGVIRNRLTAGDKKARLIAALKKMNPLLVAFSGGVDSAFLLAAANETLGREVTAATAVSPIHPLRERMEAITFARERDIPHLLFSSHESDLPEFLANGPNRCYHCKKSLFETLWEIARKMGFHYIVHGANVDDLDDYRPGLQAAVEAGIRAPLVDASLNKAEIRLLSKKMGLPQWDKPSMACLASRLPYGSAITEKKLNMIETAEEFLLNKGFKTLRVRHHGAVARIEAGPAERELILNDAIRKDIIKKFRHIGFSHIALDLEEFTSGKMNRSINT